MASELDHKSLEQAFGGRPDIQGAIKAAAGMPPFINVLSLSPAQNEVISKPAIPS